MVAHPDLPQQVGFRGSPEELVVQDEQPRTGPRRELRELGRRRMGARVIPLPRGGPPLEALESAEIEKIIYHTGLVLFLFLAGVALLAYLRQRLLGGGGAAAT